MTVEQETKSTHRVEVVDVNFEKHPNADTLSVTPIYGYTYVGRTTDWVGVKRAAYIPPDSTVDVKRPEFAHLAPDAKADGRARIKAKKLRGVVSYGLCVPVPDDTPLGEDWAARLGVEHYEPPLEHEKGGGKMFLGGEVAASPTALSCKYDVDSFLRYHGLFRPGEPVVVTEKLDGANARYVFADGKMHCGSRTEWKKEFPSYEHVTLASLTEKGVPEDKAKDILDRLHATKPKKNIWWAALEANPPLEKFCREHEGLVVYGEVYGNVNCIKYGFAEGNRFAAFDILHGGIWVDAMASRDMLEGAGVPVVPVFRHDWGDAFQACTMPYDFDAIKALAEGLTVVGGAKPNTIREGVVVKPLRERWDYKAGRVCFKVVNPTFLEKFR